MKIAVLGNMNNNGFAVMRYLRDLGVDAHLLLYANDGIGTLSHFRPEDDTWDIERWAPYIHQTPIVNSLYNGLTGFYVLFTFMMALKAFFRPTGEPRLQWISRRKAIKALDDYDVYIASGIAPALFHRIGKTLDVFYPYGTGIEHLGVQEQTSRLPHMGVIKKAVTLKAMQAQKDGVRAARQIFNAEYSLTKDILNGMGVPFQSLAIPMVYTETKVDPAQFSSDLADVLARLGQQRYILACSRQVWVRPPHMADDQWLRESKNSDWLIKAFARLNEERPRLDLELAISAYGPDVEAAKALCRELGVDKNVVWMPKLARKELAIVARGACAVVGEFKCVDEMIWGGVGWEALAAGKPLVHSFRFAPGRYETLYGTPPPPVLAVSSQTDVYDHLLRIADDPEFLTEFGAEASRWFSRHCGSGLTKRWVDLIGQAKA